MTQYAIVDAGTQEITGVVEVDAEQYAALVTAGIASSWIETPAPVSNATHYYDGTDFVAYTAPQAEEKSARPVDYPTAWSNTSFEWEDQSSLAEKQAAATAGFKARQELLAIKQGPALRRAVIALAASTAVDTADATTLDEIDAHYEDLATAITDVAAATTLAGVEAVTVAYPTAGWWL